MQNLETVGRSGVLEKASHKVDNWVFEGMVMVKELGTSSIRRRLRALQCVCEDRGEIVLTTNVDVIKLVREGIAIKDKNETMSSRQTALKTELVRYELPGIRCTIKLLRRRIG